MRTLPVPRHLHVGPGDDASSLLLLLLQCLLAVHLCECVRLQELREGKGRWKREGTPPSPFLFIRSLTAVETGCERTERRRCPFFLSPLWVSVRVVNSGSMGSKSSVASSSSSPAAAGVAAQEAPPGFSNEEQAALQWALEEKEREPTKVRCCCCSLLAGFRETVA